MRANYLHGFHMYNEYTSVKILTNKNQYPCLKDYTQQWNFSLKNSNYVTENEVTPRAEAKEHESFSEVKSGIVTHSVSNPKSGANLPESRA